MGAMVGTPLYLSPEQAQGREVDERSDIFSLGVVPFEMAAGHTPFVSDRREGTVHQIIHTLVLRIRSSNPAFPAELDDIVRHALEKSASARHPRMVDLEDDCILSVTCLQRAQT